MLSKDNDAGEGAGNDAADDAGMTIITYLIIIALFFFTFLKMLRIELFLSRRSV